MICLVDILIDLQFVPHFQTLNVVWEPSLVGLHVLRRRRSDEDGHQAVLCQSDGSLGSPPSAEAPSAQFERPLSVIVSVSDTWSGFSGLSTTSWQGLQEVRICFLCKHDGHLRPVVAGRCRQLKLIKNPEECGWMWLFCGKRGWFKISVEFNVFGWTTIKKQQQGSCFSVKLWSDEYLLKLRS